MVLETTAASLSGRHLGDTGNDFIVAEWRQAGTPKGKEPEMVAPPHIHFSDDESWYVLEGTLCVRRGDEIITVPAGSGVMVPKGMPHTFWNPSTKACRYLIVMTPRIFDLITNLHKPGRTMTAAEVFKAHESELLY